MAGGGFGEWKKERKGVTWGQLSKLKAATLKIWSWGPFTNYVTHSLPIFDHPTTYSNDLAVILSMTNLNRESVAGFVIQATGTVEF